ncbi:hypothetical protein BDN70DRAFT_886681 [Pholiota conissans]|uniref:Uncharacterized protein n=1 Tax=Pholiota conissans TaxID=109636 RepID=A0A9P6CU32_9AGAR|nr:hypothetical protein BDN70DRAFT_886681 [Pholiota conissans]
MMLHVVCSSASLDMRPQAGNFVAILDQRKYISSKNPTLVLQLTSSRQQHTRYKPFRPRLQNCNYRRRMVNELAPIIRKSYASRELYFQNTTDMCWSSIRGVQRKFNRPIESPQLVPIYLPNTSKPTEQVFGVAGMFVCVITSYWVKNGISQRVSPSPAPTINKRRSASRSGTDWDPMFLQEHLYASRSAHPKLHTQL